MIKLICKKKLSAIQKPVRYFKTNDSLQVVKRQLIEYTELTENDFEVVTVTDEHIRIVETRYHELVNDIKHQISFAHDPLTFDIDYFNESVKTLGILNDELVAFDNAE